MAAVQATGRDDPTNPSRFPDPLWPLVERFLMSHFHARSGFTGSRYISPTEAAVRRAKAGSVQSKACGSCEGYGYHYRGTDRSQMCERCHGSGRTEGQESKNLHATVACL